MRHRSATASVMLTQTRLPLPGAHLRFFSWSAGTRNGIAWDRHSVGATLLLSRSSIATRLGHHFPPQMPAERARAVGSRIAALHGTAITRLLKNSFMPRPFKKVQLQGGAHKGE